MLSPNVSLVFTGQSFSCCDVSFLIDRDSLLICHSLFLPAHLVTESRVFRFDRSFFISLLQRRKRRRVSKRDWLACQRSTPVSDRERLVRCYYRYISSQVSHVCCHYIPQTYSKDFSDILFSQTWSWVFFLIKKHDRIIFLFANYLEK